MIVDHGVLGGTLKSMKIDKHHLCQFKKHVISNYNLIFTASSNMHTNTFYPSNPTMLLYNVKDIGVSRFWGFVFLLYFIPYRPLTLIS